MPPPAPPSLGAVRFLSRFLGVARFAEPFDVGGIEDGDARRLAIPPGDHMMPLAIHV